MLWLPLEKRSDYHVDCNLSKKSVRMNDFGQFFMFDFSDVLLKDKNDS